MLTWNTAPLVANDILSVTWLSDSTRFWYRVSRPAGHEFVLVDPVASTQRPLFDHLKLASALTRMTRSISGREPSIVRPKEERRARRSAGDAAAAIICWIVCREAA